MQAFPPVNKLPELPALADKKRDFADDDGVDEASGSVFALLLSQFESTQVAPPPSIEIDSPDSEEGVQPQNRIHHDLSESRLQADVSSQTFSGLSEDLVLPAAVDGNATQPIGLVEPGKQAVPAEQPEGNFPPEFSLPSQAEPSLAHANRVLDFSQTSQGDIEPLGAVDVQEFAVSSSVSSLQDGIESFNFSQPEILTSTTHAEGLAAENDFQTDAQLQLASLPPSVESASVESVQARPLLATDGVAINGPGVSQDTQKSVVDQAGFGTTQPSSAVGSNVDLPVNGSESTAALGVSIATPERAVDAEAANTDPTLDSAAVDTTDENAITVENETVDSQSSEGSQDGLQNSVSPPVVAKSAEDESSEEEPSGEADQDVVDNADTPLDSSLAKATSEKEGPAKFGVQGRFSQKQESSVDLRSSLAAPTQTRRRFDSIVDSIDGPANTQSASQSANGEAASLPLQSMNNDVAKATETTGVPVNTRTTQAETIQAIVNQLVAESTAAVDGKTITIRFEDPHIGSVKLEMTETDSGMSVSVAAGDELTLEMLNSNAQQFERSLKDNQIELLEIVSLQMQTAAGEQNHSDQTFQQEVSETYRSSQSSTSGQQNVAETLEESGATLDFRA